MDTLSNLNLGASCLHIGLAIGFSIYFIYLNKSNPNNPVSGIEMSIRNHIISLTRNSDQSVGKRPCIQSRYLYRTNPNGTFFSSD